MFRLCSILCLAFVLNQADSRTVSCSTKFSDLVEPFVSVVCPRHCVRRPGKVCGTRHYTGDSFVCKSAAHAGNLVDAVGGALGILRGPGRSLFPGTRRNGVDSIKCHSDKPNSFSFVRSFSDSAFFEAPAGDDRSCSSLPKVPDEAVTCPPSLCKNGGKCVADGYTLKCECMSGYAGDDCFFAKVDCLTQPCKNGGSCQNITQSNNNYAHQCVCPQTFTGKECETTLSDCFAGVHEGGSVNNSQMSASSFFSDQYLPKFGRLYNSAVGKTGPQGCWAPKRLKTGEWLQVDFLTKNVFYGVVTQGRPTRVQYQTSYKISYSNDGTNFVFALDHDGQEKVFSGNINQNDIKVNYFPNPIKARYIRVVSNTWHKFPSLRLEYLLC